MHSLFYTGVSFTNQSFLKNKEVMCGIPLIGYAYSVDCLLTTFRRIERLCRGISLIVYAYSVVCFPTANASFFSFHFYAKSSFNNPIAFESLLCSSVGVCPPSVSVHGIFVRCFFRKGRTKL